MPLDAVFSPRWAARTRGAAEAKAAPADHVFAALLVACGSLIGNARWPSPWAGWAEPPVPWAALIGSPSMNGSPGLDAVLGPLAAVEKPLREAAKADHADRRAKAEVAKLAEAAWEEVKAAIKAGEKPPKRPEGANPGPEPALPRLRIVDATIEKPGVILAGQPRGTLMVRDELAGWLQGMMRHSGGGSDRPFRLEACGGRSHGVERMGREAGAKPEPLASGPTGRGASPGAQRPRRRASQPGGPGGGAGGRAAQSAQSGGSRWTASNGITV